MIVLDASAMLELLLATDIGRQDGQRIRGTESLHAPQLLVIECIQVIRRTWMRGDIDAELGALLIDDLLALDIELYDHELIATRTWELRDNLTAYDAAYVALSELLGAPLVTTDAKLAGAPGNDASLELIRSQRPGSPSSP